MKTLVIIGHPNPESSYTQQFLMDVAKYESSVSVKRLDKKEEYDQLDCNYLKTFTRIVFVFPVYWYSVPYQMKQWIDETFREGQRDLEGVEFGVVATFGVSKRHYQAGEKEQFSVPEMLRPMQMMANHFKMIYLQPFTLFQFDYMTPGEKKQLIVDYLMYLTAPKSPSFCDRSQWLSRELEKMNEERLYLQIDHQQDQLDELQLALRQVRGK